ncbi:hypothetical protein [Nioella nitratireducens]|uniref:hypothetical protein n=1 Tax=Nioella nitratireducens TaxID=1287720 RepID=UPI0008FD0EB8|nr:hypothetical protein [Nioella nitratireducens]
MSEHSRPPAAPPSWREALPRLALKLAVLVGVVLLAHGLIGVALAWVDSLPAHVQAPMHRLVFVAIFLCYGLLIAVPFVPGIEIAIALLMLRGPEFAVPIYISTLAGLMLAYCVGRLVPIRSLRHLFLDLHLTRAAQLVEQLDPLSPDQRVEMLASALPHRFSQMALRHRYLAMAALINMPGSGLIGGGGGICLMAGASGLFVPRKTVLLLTVAILPFPVFMWSAGSSGWMPWLPN